MPNQQLQIVILDNSNLPKPFRKARYSWGEQDQGYKVFACHKAQLDILASKAKFTFAFAGSGGGKTCLIPLWIFKQVTRLYQQGVSKPRILVVSPTVKTFKRSQLKQHILETFSDTAYQGRWKEQDQIYELPMGGEIVVITAEKDPSRLRGGQYHAAIADECYLLSYESYEEIRRRVSNYNGPILAVTTPDANNWIWDIKQACDKGDKDYYCRHWSKLANPSVSKEDIERERSLQSEARYKRMIDGEFSALEGLVYEGFSNPESELYPVIKGDPLKVGFPGSAKPVRFVGGNDWGYGDPSAVYMAAECDDGNLYIVEEIYDSKITPDDLAIKVQAMIDRWIIKVDSRYASMVIGNSFVGFYTDTSRPELGQMFRRAGIPIKNKRVSDIVSGIGITDSWFRAGRLKIYSTCPNLIRELRSYQWDGDKPKAGNDHSCDSLRYLVSSHKYGVAVTPANPPELDEDEELQKVIRLGHLPADPILRQSILKETEANRLKEEQEKRFLRLLMADSD